MSNLSELKSIKAKADIVEVIGHFVQLKRKAANYEGFSPFSNERSPSFVVNPVKQFFKCFSTGKSGDVFDFVELVKHIPKHEAIKWVRDFYNILPEPDYIYTPPEPLPVSFFPIQDVYANISRRDKPNYFIDWLTKIFDTQTASDLATRYNIGTSKHWQGANIFWQVDIENRCRSGKIMVYNSETGKRIKKPDPLITWVHRAAKMKNFNLSSCLFGEHLISVSNLPICIVESEKTAIVSSVIYPQYLFIASGSLTNLSVHRCQCLVNREIILCPDVGFENQWIEKCNQLAELIPAKWSVRPLKGNYEKGYDLCDYILDNKI